VVEATDLVAACRFEERLGPHRVGPEEERRVEYRIAVVGLGGEVHDRVDVLGLEDLLDLPLLADVALDERDAVPHVGEVGLVARIRQQIEGDDVVVRPLRCPVADEVRSDEARCSCDE
jgi:hypothetical protein